MSFNLKDYLGVKAAAKYIGVCPTTMRNWDRAGKLPVHKNPMNGHRLYRREDLRALLEEIEASGCNKKR